MYHVVMGIAPEDAAATDKAEAVADLPAADSAVRVTVVHVADAGVDVTEVPAVARALDVLDAAGVESEVVRAEGDPRGAVLSTASERDADLICVAGRQRSPAGKRQLKGGAQRVLLGAGCPVLVAGRVENPTEQRTE